jgi:hypothetical protein
MIAENFVGPIGVCRPPQWGGTHYTNALCQRAGREAVKDLKERGQHAADFECVDGRSERVPIKWHLAPLGESSCEGFTAKQCAQIHKTGCLYNIGPGRPCRAGYSRDREDLE